MDRWLYTLATVCPFTKSYSYARTIMYIQSCILMYYIGTYLYQIVTCAHIVMYVSTYDIHMRLYTVLPLINAPLNGRMSQL